ncbi:MAG: alpha-L-arabinofuranosidase C-terminal domain-containing protein [Verrucomicrobiota bacterium]
MKNNALFPCLAVTCAAWLLLASHPASQAADPAATLTVQVDQPGHQMAPTLWGIFFEDINLSADGGIYPELVRNRSFEDAEKPDHWQIVNHGEGKSEMAIDTKEPLNPLNRRSLRVRLNGAVSLGNSGYWGMSIAQGETYRFHVAARCADGFQGPLQIVLERADGTGLAKGTIDGLTGKWNWFSLDLTASATEPKAKLALGAAGPGTVWFDMVSLLPKKTWKDHGLRPDLSEMLTGLKPAFVRFPGGCWVEGEELKYAYRWKETIGDIAHRKPLWNIWQYHATHGLGFHEYLQLSEDLGAEPLFCINVGMSHREDVPMDQMSQWVQDALDAVEYANGPANTVWGGRRAKNGHPAPFHMKYLEIGNENGGPAYHERWELFYRAIKAKYPEIQLIANVWGGYPTNLMPDIVDEHYYSHPEFFIQQAHKYDSYKRNGPKIFVGEYAVTSGSGLGNLRGAVGEAAFMTGLERNSDVVIMASYAPLFVNANYKRWPINLINFDSSRAFGLPSYYVQKMFSEHRGEVVLPVEVEAPVVSAGPAGGAIGVGTWLTQAEFKDIKVTSGGETLYTCDFAGGTEGWKLLGGGEWQARDGSLRQTSNRENIRAIAGDKKWTDYTYSLKARKLSGAEGFLILFRVQEENAKSWWNLGGWGNQRHAIEKGGIIGNEVPGHIETGRWYDIRIELKGANIKCYLDGQLLHDADCPSMKSLYASASHAKATGEVILKVVNVSTTNLTTQINLRGAEKVGSSAQAIVLASKNPTDENSLTEPVKVAPVTQTIEKAGANFSHTFPGNSVTVLRLQTTK